MGSEHSQHILRPFRLFERQSCTVLAVRDCIFDVLLIWSKETNMFKQLFFPCLFLMVQQFFSADRFADAGPVPAPTQNYYKLIVNFKRPLGTDDMMGLMASKPIILADRNVTISAPSFPRTPITSGEVLIVIIGPGLSDSDKDSVSKFASLMVDSYIGTHGNGVSSANIENADPPNARRQLEDIQQKIDDLILGDISSS